MSQIVEVPGVGQVEFPEGMSDGDIVKAIKNLSMRPADPRPEAERPALMNPNLAAQGAKARSNMTPPTSIMDPRFPAWRQSQDQASALEAVAGVAMPAVGAAIAPGAGLVAAGGRALMQRAMKPTQRDLLEGKAQRGAETLLRDGISVTPGGMEKLRSLADDANAEAGRLIANSTAHIDKNAVAQRLDGTDHRFARQVVPQGDQAAIQDVRNNFLAHPLVQGQTMPVQLAQEMKQGTYAQLRDKYGQLGTADTEAQKSLARGLKEEIETAVPGVGPTNARASELWNALNVTERRALIARNNNLLGLAPLSGDLAYSAMFLLDRMPLTQSLVAHGIYGSQRVPGAVGGGAVGALMQPEPLRGALSTAPQQQR